MLVPRSQKGNKHAADLIRDVREVYKVPGNGDVADKAVLEKLDAVLNGKIAIRNFKRGGART